MNILSAKIREAYESSKILSTKDTIFINGLSNLDISIENVKSGSELWTYIYYVGSNKRRHIYKKFKKGILYSILFMQCINSRILVLDDILKITLLHCEKCQLSTRNLLTGPLEFIKCKNINADIRTNHPYIQIDISEGIHIYQRTPEIVYIIGKSCDNIKGVILESGLEKIKKVPMIPSTIVLFSRTGIYQAFENNLDKIDLIEKNHFDEEPAKTIVTLGFSPVD